MKNKDYFKKARENQFAIGQFNISNLETLKGVVFAAQNLNSPIIIGTSENESKFLGLKETVALVDYFRKETKLPIFLNLDHGKSFDYIKKAIDCGFDMVSFDGSVLNLQENIKITKEIVKFAHSKGVFIEGEFNFITGSSRVLSENPEIKETDLTNPEDAERFAKETGVDSLAVNIGTFHGISASGINPHINLQRLKEIEERVNNKAFLVLHGGSGTPEEDIKEAIKLGIVKININTELRIAFTNALKDSFVDNPKEVVPYKYLQNSIGTVQKVVENKIKLFGSQNRI